MGWTHYPFNTPYKAELAQIMLDPSPHRDPRDTLCIIIDQS